MEIIWCWSSASDSCVEWISFSRWKWLVTFWRIVIFLICTFVVSGYVMSHWRVIFFIFCRKIWHICNQNIFRILFLILCNLILRLADIFFIRFWCLNFCEDFDECLWYKWERRWGYWGFVRLNVPNPSFNQCLGSGSMPMLVHEHDRLGM